MHTDLRRTGWFTCSDDRVNALHEAAVWSFRDNACDIPTDCPHRERAGWTGDWQLYVPTAAFLYDVAGFSAKWLRDVAADQWDDGDRREHVADRARRGARRPGRRSSTARPAGATPLVIVPWELYRAYGDAGSSPSCGRTWSAGSTAPHGRPPSGRHPAANRPAQAARALPVGHRLPLGRVAGARRRHHRTSAAFAGRDKSDVATAFFARSAELSRIAAVLGRGRTPPATPSSQRVSGPPGGPSSCRRRRRSARPPRPTWCGRSRSGWCRTSSAQRAAAQLVELIRDAGTHLGTGFLATPDLLPVLADHGHADVAYELLLQDTPPSWLAMIDRGATTVWERWEGIDDDGVPHESLNHYSKGAVISFLHRYTAGHPAGDDAGLPLVPRRAGARRRAHLRRGRARVAVRADRVLLDAGPRRAAP